MSQDQSIQTLPSVLDFAGTDLQIIDHAGRPWVTAADLARALGYKHADQVSKIFNRRAHEFSEDMTGTVKLAVPGNRMPIPVRIFSPRGAHLIAMFARTAKAEAFRRWVLDVLEGYDRPALAPQNAGSVDSTDLLGHLRLTRILFTLDGDGRPQAQAVPDDAGLIRPADLHQWVEDPTLLERAELERVALAALRRLETAGGQHAIRKLLAALDPNYLLVLESELILSLYGSPAVYDKLARGGRDD